MSGVEIHAQLLNMLLLNKKLYPLKHSFTLILILCYSILFFFLFIIPLPRFFFYGGLLLLFILALLLPVIVFHQNSIIFPFITALICAILWVFILYWARMAIKVQEFKKAVSEFNAEHHNPFLDFCKKHTISKREEEVILLLLKNLTTMQIANKLFISLYTVKKHLTNIYQKTGMENREKLCEALAQKSLN
jgi:DNA-binding CsgD family transcriptional regulator